MGTAMEILDITFARVPIWVWAIGAWAIYAVKTAWRDHKAHKATNKQVDEALSKFRADHE
jgi:hypothetical protein